MENNSLSVRLASKCCDCNYLKSVCNKKALIFRGRSYFFMWSDYCNQPFLHCNGVCIGVVKKGELVIYPQFKSVIPSRSFLLSLASMFNLYPI